MGSFLEVSRCVFYFSPENLVLQQTDDEMFFFFFLQRKRKWCCFLSQTRINEEKNLKKKREKKRKNHQQTCAPFWVHIHTKTTHNDLTLQHVRKRSQSFRLKISHHLTRSLQSCYVIPITYHWMGNLTRQYDQTPSVWVSNIWETLNMTALLIWRLKCLSLVISHMWAPKGNHLKSISELKAYD